MSARAGCGYGIASVPYPLQNNLRYLPKDEQWTAIRGLITQYRKPKSEPIANFREWIYATFGAGLAEVFLEPYNFKVWAHPLEQMDYQWIGERVAVVDLERVIKNVIFDLDDIGWGPNNTFQFPKRGGTGAIWQGVADLVGRDKIRLNTPVCHVDLTNKLAIVNKDSRIKYELSVQHHAYRSPRGDVEWRELSRQREGKAVVLLLREHRRDRIGRKATDDATEKMLDVFSRR